MDDELGIDWAKMEAQAVVGESRRKALELMTVFFDEGEDVFVQKVRDHFDEDPNQIVTGFIVLSEFLLRVTGKQFGMSAEMMAHALLNIAEDY